MRAEFLFADGKQMEVCALSDKDVQDLNNHISMPVVEWIVLNGSMGKAIINKADLRAVFVREDRQMPNDLAAKP